MVFDISQLKKIRKQLEMTQNQFAKKVGISQSMIAKIESGKLDPTYSYVKKIENAINSLTKHEEKEAQEVMAKNIITAKLEEKMPDVIKIMNRNKFSQLPILKNGKVMGLITESSILEKDLEEIKNLKAKDLMMESPPIISENAKISVIIPLLKHFPTVLISKQGKLKGLITKADLLKSLL